MPVQDRAVRPDQNDGVVERSPAELTVALVKADRYGQLQPPRRRLQRLEVTGLEVDRVLDQPPVDLRGQAVIATRAQPPKPLGISG